MPLHLHWYLPTRGDDRGIVSSNGEADFGADGARNPRFRPPTIEYLGQIARAAEQLGYEALLTPTGLWCEDAWIVTAALTQVTNRLRFLVAFRPGLISPTLAAHQAATFQRVSGGRLLLNVVTGGDSAEQRRLGDHLDHDQRYARTDEFLTVLRGVAGAKPAFSFTGEHYDIQEATVDVAPWGRPPIFFGGASPAAERVAARRADVYLAWGETPAQITERLDRMRSLAAAAGRADELRFGIRFHVISRDTAAQAWAEADRLLAGLDDARIAAHQAVFAASESVGQRRMAALHGGDRTSLEVYPNVWAGYGLVRGGAGTAIVGSHEQVAERIEEYHALGLDHFILSGQPHLEEAYQMAEGAAELLRARGLLAARRPHDSAGGVPGGELPAGAVR
ncbi:LLM class flavin-dependent oxidoreductase [Parafrankia sp. EUN1f]|uniref:LLM class flavin-dependent oxidoreductase n=1 Tax=Parafrankia sp. EUN1f TaxID=102897 RepID=UPI0001C46BAF|nr:LLM class flavin-dependent oxidoreductase [Parafrankia sp. EUN1f]EFC82665.1 Alkanesulfonate monooxygenase [Parafrankia sp. EUN1f]